MIVFQSQQRNKMKFAFHALCIVLISVLTMPVSALAQPVFTQQDMDRERASIERDKKEVRGGNASATAPAEVVFVNLELASGQPGPYVLADAYKDGNFFIKAWGFHPTSPRTSRIPGLTYGARSVVGFNVFTHEIKGVRVDFDVYLKCADGSYVVRRDRNERVGTSIFDEAKYRKGFSMGFASMGCKPDVKAQAIGFTNVKLKPLN